MPPSGALPFRIAPRGTVAVIGREVEFNVGGGVFFLLISLAVTGLVIGALGRLVVPGPNPMGLLATAGVGLGGAIIGGLFGHLVFGFRYRYAYGLGFILSVLGAALIVVLIERSRHNT